MGRSSTENILQSWTPHRLKWDFTPRLTRSGTVGQLVIVAAPQLLCNLKKADMCFPRYFSKCVTRISRGFASFVVSYLLDIYWDWTKLNIFFPKGFGPIRASYQAQGYKRCQSQAWQASEGPVVPEPREGEIMPCIYPCVTRWYDGYHGGLSSTDPWWYLNILSVVRCPSELRRENPFDQVVMETWHKKTGKWWGV